MIVVPMCNPNTLIADIPVKEEDHERTSFASKYLAPEQNHDEIDDDQSIGGTASRGRRSTKVQLRGVIKNRRSVNVTPKEKTNYRVKEASEENKELSSSRHRSHTHDPRRGGRLNRRLCHLDASSHIQRARRTVELNEDETQQDQRDHGEENSSHETKIKEKGTQLPVGEEKSPIDFEEFSIHERRTTISMDPEDDSSESLDATQPSSLLQDMEEDASEEGEDILINLVNSLHKSAHTQVSGTPSESERSEGKTSKKLRSSTKDEKKKNDKKSSKKKKNKKDQDKGTNTRNGESVHEVGFADLESNSAAFVYDDKKDKRCIYENVDRISIQLLIHKGENLLPKDRTLFGKLKTSDPYVEVWRNLPSTQVGKTATKYKTLDPQYEERFKVVWTHTDLLRSMSRQQRARIMLKIWDYDNLSEAESMGEVSIPIPLPKENLTIRNQWFDVDKGSIKDARGRVQVSLKVKYEKRS